MKISNQIRKILLANQTYSTESICKEHPQKLSPYILIQQLRSTESILKNVFFKALKDVILRCNIKKRF
jgi:hypothetical protein